MSVSNHYIFIENRRVSVLLKTIVQWGSSVGFTSVKLHVVTRAFKLLHGKVIWQPNFTVTLFSDLQNMVLNPFLNLLQRNSS